MRLFDRITRGSSPQRSTLSLEQYIDMLKWNGSQYPVLQQSLVGSREEITRDFVGLVSQAYQSDGIVFACVLARMMVFSEARFQFRQLVNGRPGDLFGTQELRILERPEPGRTTGDLLARAEQDVSMSGNFFATRQGDRIKRLRPDWVSIVLGSRLRPDAGPFDLDVEVVGYVYEPGGPGGSSDPVLLLPEEVCHYAPIPDPMAVYRGMSWLSPVLADIESDLQATEHKVRMFERGATPNMIVTLQESRASEFEKWVSLFREEHEGVANAYKTLFLGAGADAKVVGSSMRDLEFRATQGAGETRIASAAGVPPIIAGFSEGLSAATYSNYGQARRRFSDGTIRPLWRNFCGSMSSIINVPSGAELWYDDRDIAFLAEDQKDEAEIQQMKAATIKSLIDAGYDADSVVAAVTSGDLNRLQHSGLFSVQLQPAGTDMGSPSAPSSGATP